MKKYIKNGATYYICDGEEWSEFNLRLLWWLYMAEQLEDKLTKDEVDAINDIVKNNEYGEMWEIDEDEEEDEKPEPLLNQDY